MASATQTVKRTTRRGHRRVKIVKSGSGKTKKRK